MKKDGGRKFPVNLLTFAIGLVLLAAGTYLIYPPAALILAGLILMIVSSVGESQ